MSIKNKLPETEKLNYTDSEILNDYYIAQLSRQLCMLGRREVHSGRAHFGIFGGGKELVQIAYAKFFQAGDWRSGYYRDQTFMLALGLLKPEEFFAMIYGETDSNYNPSTGGRNFNNHFSTSNVNELGEIKDLMEQYNSASDISPTAGQIPRLLGLAQASKIVRNQPELKASLNNNVHGNEVAFGAIGDASTSEGMFFETINAAGVLQVPLAICVYDDGYGISVPKALQTTKASISEALAGFAKSEDSNGWHILKCNGWDYPQMLKVIGEGIELCRSKQEPVLFHVEELTQPFGHSTSGSHERYKSKERLAWEKEYDCMSQFRKYLLESGEADEELLKKIEKSAVKRAKDARDNAWKHYVDSYIQPTNALEKLIDAFKNNPKHPIDFSEKLLAVKGKTFPTRRAIFGLARELFLHSHLIADLDKERQELQKWMETYENDCIERYNGQLYREGADSTLKVEAVAPTYADDAEMVTGSSIISSNFLELFKQYPNAVTFGEDTGFMGDVNQGTKGLQEAFGTNRVSDTGIRETTIIGQGIGLALRGFRPIAEIQYLDYINYALPSLSDDVASLQYRTMGKQACPLIVRTRGHQLQGIWHAGSPMQMLLGSMRGMFLCVPRNMTQAAGMYNTLLAGNDAAIVIEPLKGYNMKEKMPSNIGKHRVAMGTPEVLVEGTDVTLVTYAWNVNHAVKSAKILKERKNISVEVIDVQTLLPFDVHHTIVESVKKTNKLVVLDEDVPGGASAYIMHKIMHEQKAFDYLDCQPICIHAAEHRPAYGIDGEFFTKPNVSMIVEEVYNMMRSVDEKRYGKL
ncbi:MAG: thiamine pyrophosphate-dependent enzyme [Mangrovibacterium sp.]